MRPAPLGRARKTAPFGRALLAVAIVWATCGVFAGSAGAQEPFPDPASMDLAELTGHAQVWLTAEIDLLAELGEIACELAADEPVAADDDVLHDARSPDALTSAR